MAKEYLDKLSKLIDELHLKDEIGPQLEGK
jgi:hypothetical protein